MGLGISKFWILWQPWTDSHLCPLPWWGIRNSCGIKSRQLVLSCTCSLILGIRNSEYFYNYKQTIVFVPCHDGGSEILNPCGIKNRLPFCSVKLWARGSEILNLSKKESGMGARSLSHEIAQFDGIRKLDVLFLVDTTEHFFSPSN